METQPWPAAKYFDGWYADMAGSAVSPNSVSPRRGGHTGGVSPFAAEALAEGHRALTQDPVCGIDGKLAPVVDQADYAQAPGAVSRHEEGHSVRDLVGAPREIVIRSDRLAGGVEGFARVLEGLLRAVQ